MFQLYALFLINLPNHDLANLFTPKRKSQKLSALEGDGRDGDLLDNGNLDSGDFNNDNKINDYLGNIDEQVLTQDIIIAISVLANTIKYYEHSQIKVKESDLFDSTDLQKLINFISQCQLTFCTFPDIYQNDDQKVSFAIIYLCEAIFNFSEPYLIDLMSILHWQ